MSIVLRKSVFLLSFRKLKTVADLCYMHYASFRSLLTVNPDERILQLLCPSLSCCMWKWNLLKSLELRTWCIPWRFPIFVHVLQLTCFKHHRESRKWQICFIQSDYWGSYKLSMATINDWLIISITKGTKGCLAKSAVVRYCTDRSVTNDQWMALLWPIYLPKLRSSIQIPVVGLVVSKSKRVLIVSKKMKIKNQTVFCNIIKRSSFKFSWQLSWLARPGQSECVSTLTWFSCKVVKHQRNCLRNEIWQIKQLLKELFFFFLLSPKLDIYRSSKVRGEKRRWNQHKFS